MNTPSTSPLSRRTFLGRLVAAAGLAPLVVAAAKQPSTPQPLDLSITTYPLDSKVHHARGAAIKVPSNRRALSVINSPMGSYSGHTYIGNWDGTFKLEHGCTNPAYILADLYERTDEEPDWVVADKSVPACLVGGPMVMTGVRQLLKPRLNWQMLYDWGQWCDEVVTGWLVTDGSNGYGIQSTTPGSRPGWRDLTASRMVVNNICRTPEEMTHLRETLRMHCLRWQSTDPRYRTSYPGVPYPNA